MTFWTKLQHELLCFVCAEDVIFDSAGDHKGEHSHIRFEALHGGNRYRLGLR